MKYICFYLILGLLFLFACTEEVITDVNYPTTKTAVSTQAYSHLADKLEETPLANCTVVDTFGYLLPLADTEICIDSNWRANYTYLELETLAKTAVADYKKFLDVNDPSQFEVKSITTLKKMGYDAFYKAYPDSSPWCWVVRSEPQFFNGLEVRGTNLTVVVSPIGVVALGGNWFSDIYVPEQTKVTEDSAKALLLSKTLEYGSSKLIVTENTTWGESQFMVVPIKKMGSIELRVCWVLHPETWEVLIDSHSGKQFSTINLSKI
jgi:hypothetical protein